jgi:hypothetical protein
MAADHPTWLRAEGVWNANDRELSVPERDGERMPIGALSDDQ